MTFPSSAAIQASNENPVLDRWLEALRQDSPKLPSPIAFAMVQSITRSPFGQPLCEIEQALMQIEASDWHALTGSEVRVLTAVLRQMNRTILNLDAQLAQLYLQSES